MGACIRKRKVHQNVREYVCSELVAAIEMGRVEVVKSIYAKYMKRDARAAVFDVDEDIVTLQEVKRM